MIVLYEHLYSQLVTLGTCERTHICSMSSYVCYVVVFVLFFIINWSSVHSQQCLENSHMNSTRGN